MLSKLGGSIRPRKKSVALGFLNNLVAVLEHQTSQQQELMTQDKKLNEVIDEILVTEATYLEDLSFTVDELQRPLKEMMDAHTHYTVFSNLEQLRELHIKLGADLSEAREDNCSTHRQGEVIAEAFLRLLPYFKMYAVYCGNAATAAGALAAATEGGDAAAFLQRKEQDPASRATLAALLFRPVQRMCIYPLLFKQVLKYAVEGHPQHNAFTKLKEVVEQTVQEVNENVRGQEAHHRMLEVLTSEVSGASVAGLLAAARTLEMEAMVDLKASGMWNMKRITKWYIFNDLLLICRPNKLDSGFHQKLLLPLEEVAVSTARAPAPARTRTHPHSRTRARARTRTHPHPHPHPHPHAPARGRAQRQARAGEAPGRRQEGGGGVERARLGARPAREAHRGRLWLPRWCTPLRGRTRSRRVEYALRTRDLHARRLRNRRVARCHRSGTAVSARAGGRAAGRAAGSAIAGGSARAGVSARARRQRSRPGGERCEGASRRREARAARRRLGRPWAARLCRPVNRIGLRSAR